VTRRDEELDDEIAAHLKMAVEERVARGESRADAERAVRREFGNIGHVKEVTRDMRSGMWAERLSQDVRYGLRALRRTPAFTVVAVLTLAIGIGANSAMFTVVNGVLLRPLPFSEPYRLFLASYLPPTMMPGTTPGLFDGAYLEFHQRTHVFERVANFHRAAVTLTDAGDATRLYGARVGVDFLRVLGVAPAIGRGFTHEEGQPGRDAVVILSDQLWRERFGADSSVAGKAATLDGTRYAVIGVMPPGFNFPSNSELWTPLVTRLDSGNSFLQQVVGRLQPGATPGQARDELESIMRAMPRDPRSDGTPGVARIVRLQELVSGKIEKSLLILSAAVAFVLLIACANVANLLLIRAASRRHEMAVRAALGASRKRLVTQLITESTLVAIIGGALGTAIAIVGVRVLLAMAPEGRIPRAAEIGVDWRVLAFTLGVSLATGLGFGLVPAMQGSKRPPRDALNNGARTITGRHTRVRGMLVVGEIALALVLLSGAGLMVKSFLRMRAFDTGFEAGNVVTMTATLPNATYGEVARLQAFHTAMLERLSGIPGVVAAGAVSWTPLGDVGVMGDFNAEGAAARAKGYYADKPSTSAGYFATMGIRMLRGRDFTARDNGTAPAVVIVSQSVAAKVWPNQDPLGKRVTMASRPRPEDWMTVVGVVSDVVQDAKFKRHSAVYRPYLQTQQPWFIQEMTFNVRTSVDPRSVMRAMRGALASVDANVAPQGLRTMDDLTTATTAEPLFQARLLTVFSLIALLLAAIGTYGVLAYDVSERSHEIGLRMVLGATRADVMRMVMRRTVLLAAPGVALGVAGALAVTGVLANFLFEVKPTDPSTLALVALLIIAVALVAGFVPAYRATRVEPAVVLPE
jgi:putative ABC transport system permease protein